MVDIILETERCSVLGMQIGYLEVIEKVLSLSIHLFLSFSFILLPAGNFNFPIRENNSFLLFIIFFSQKSERYKLLFIPKSKSFSVLITGLFYDV